MKEALASYPIHYSGIESDITNFDTLASAIKDFATGSSSLAALIYNAAGYGNGNALVQNPSNFIDDLKVSVGGFLVAYQSAYPFMKAQNRGSILVTGGGIAGTPSFDYLSLGMGKTAVQYLVRSIAPEFANHNIHLAIVNIFGGIQEETHFSSDNIAEAFWKLHLEPKENFSYSFDYK